MSGSGRGPQCQAADWTAAAQRANQKAETGRGQDRIRLKCPGNLLLYLFLVELRADMEAAGSERYKHALFNIRKMKSDVLAACCRLCCRDDLVKLSGCKDMLSSIIERNLWSLYPPEPEDEGDRGLRAQAQRAAEGATRVETAACQQQHRPAAAIGTAGQRPAPAAAAAGTSTDPTFAFRQPGVAAHNPLEELERIFRRDPKAAALHAEVQRQQAAAAATGRAAARQTAAAAASDAGAGSGGAATAPKKRGGGRKRKSGDAEADVEAAGLRAESSGLAAAAAGEGGSSSGRAKRAAANEYMPKAGTANYAFMITLYLAHSTGTSHMTKDSLIAAADASKLADMPIAGNTNNWAAQRGPGKWYSGWSNIKTLENRDVPLIQRWSCPVKVRLTSAGMQLGATLYRHAVESGKMTANPQVPHDEDPPPGSPGMTPVHPPPPAAAAAWGSQPGASGIASSIPAANDAAPAPKWARKRQGAASAAAIDTGHRGRQNGGMSVDASADDDVANAADGVAAADTAPMRGSATHQQPRQWQPLAASQADSNKDGWDGDRDFGVDDCNKDAYADRGRHPSDDGDDDNDVGVDLADGDDLETLITMGFDIIKAQQALKVCAGSFYDALTFLTEVAPAAEEQQRPSQQQQQQDMAGTQSSQQPAACTQPTQQSVTPQAGSQLQQQQYNNPDHHRQQSQSEAWQKAQQSAGYNKAAQHTGFTTNSFAPEGDPDCEQELECDYIDDIVHKYHSHLVQGSFEEPQQQQPHPQQAGNSAQQQLFRNQAGCQQEHPQQQQQQQTKQQQHVRVQQEQQGNQRQRPAQQQGQEHQQWQTPSAGVGASNATAAVSRRRQTPAAAAMIQGAAACSSGNSNKRPAQAEAVAPHGSLSAGTAAAGGSDMAAARGSSMAATGAGINASTPGTYLGIDMSCARPWQAATLDQPMVLRLPPLQSGQTFAAVYDIVLIIDQREQYCRTNGNRTMGRSESLQRYVTTIAAQGIRVDTTATLACGDVLWVAEHNITKARYVLDWVAERKSYSDLSSSIIDGRYSNQKWVMSSDAGLAQRLYILEGSVNDLNQHGQAVSSKVLACQTAMHQTLLHDGFKVLETTGPAETVELIGIITRFLAETYGPCTTTDERAAPPIGGEVELLAAWNSRVSGCRRTKTVRQKWQELLLSVNGVGVEAVHAIVAAYPTPISLFRAYEATIQAAMVTGRSARTAAGAMLANLQQGSGQRVGPAKSQKMYEQLFMDGWNVAAS